MSDEADIEIDQLHIRLKAELAERLRYYAIRMRMEISELAEVAIQQCVDVMAELEDKYRYAEDDGDGVEIIDQRQPSGQAEDDQRQTSGDAEAQ